MSNTSQADRVQFRFSFVALLVFSALGALFGWRAGWGSPIAAYALGVMAGGAFIWIVPDWFGKYWDARLRQELGDDA